MAVLKRAIVLALALFCAAQTVFAQSSEYKLKAAYLCRVVDFIDWPAASFSNQDSPLVIGVLGHDPFGASLDEVAEGQMSKGHPLKIRRLDSLTEVSQCQAVFICSSEASKLHGDLHDLSGRPILTVSDISNFAERGGVLMFYTEANKVRFRINLDASKADNLSISSRLLQLAEVIKQGSPAP